MGNFINYDKSFGLQNTLQGSQSPAIIAQRNPTVNDAANPGQYWLNQQTNAGFINNGSLAGQAQWSQLGVGPGNVFTDLTVNPGPTNLTGVVNILTGPLTVTGISNINVNTNANTNINSGTSTGSVVIGNIASTALDLTGNAVALSSNTTLQISSNGTTTISAAPVDINLNFAGDTNINTGTSSGVVAIGNTTNCAGVAIQSVGPVLIVTDLTVGTGAGIAATAGSNIVIGTQNGGDITISAINPASGTVIIDSDDAVTVNAPLVSIGTVVGTTIHLGSGFNTATAIASAGAAINAVSITATNAAGGIQLTSPSNGPNTGVSINNGAAAASIYVGAYGAGGPGFAVPAGSIALDTNGGDANHVLWVNFDGMAGSWAPLHT